MGENTVVAQIDHRAQALELCHRIPAACRHNIIPQRRQMDESIQKGNLLWKVSAIALAEHFRFYLRYFPTVNFQAFFLGRMLHGGELFHVVLNIQEIRPRDINSITAEAALFYHFQEAVQEQRGRVIFLLGFPD